MIFNRKNIFNQFPWINEKNHRFIVSSNYDGLICAAILSHFRNWKLVGYYDLESIWISKEAKKYKNNLIWVDLNILPRQGRCIGGHITAIKDEKISGFESSCNLNSLADLNASNFKSKYPMSTALFLLWLYKITIPKRLISKMILLHSDSSWLKFQNYKINSKKWMSAMPDYNWEWLFRNVDSKTFESRIDDLLYPKLSKINAINGYSKLKSNSISLQSRELIINPDWDEDIISNLFFLFSQSLQWTSPKLPCISNRVDGQKKKVSLKEVKKIGLENFIDKNKVFSYAITSPRTMIYTSFGYKYKSPIKS